MSPVRSTVTKQTLYVSVVISILVGFMGGIIYSSLQTGSSSPVAQTNGSGQGPAGGQQQGITPDQAAMILTLEQRVKSNPTDAEAWVQLGNIYFDGSRFANAIRAYNKYQELRPGNPNVLTDLGVMYRRNSQPQEALASFDKAIAADPRHEQALFNKGIVQMYDLGDIQAAITTWEGLAAVNPTAITGNGMPISQIIDDAKKQLSGIGQ